MIWGNCIAVIIAEDTPTLRAVNPRTWIRKTDYLEQEFQPSLRSFATQRTDLLAVLEPLAHEGWSRAATVTGAGKPLVRTMHAYAQWLARHERPHVKQIERIVNTMHMEQRPPLEQAAQHAHPADAAARPRDRCHVDIWIRPNRVPDLFRRRG